MRSRETGNIPTRRSEISCCLIFIVSEENIGKVKKLLKLAPKDITADLFNYQYQIPMRFKLDKSESLVDITETYSVIDIAED